jgi:hypothetical protein
MRETQDTEERDGFGLDKDARRKAKRTVDAEAWKPDPLDPPFPYRVMTFQSIMMRRKGI